MPSEAVKKAKAVSKRRISRSRKCETDILSRVIRLEQELGSQPDLLDLLCRFTRAEIDTVWNDLLWLYPDLGKETSTDEKIVVVVA